MTDFLNVQKLLGKDMEHFAHYFAQLPFPRTSIKKTMLAFFSDVEALYGVDRATVFSLLGLDKEGYESLLHTLEDKTFSSMEASAAYVTKTAQALKSRMEKEGFRYEKNVQLPFIFQERLHLLEKFSEVRIGGSYYPLNVETYTAGYLSLWVKDGKSTL